MKLTRQQMIYLGILGVAAFGLLADRVLFSPAPAVADSLEEFAVDRTTAGVEGQGNEAPADQRTPTAEKLRAIATNRNADPGSVRNVFQALWTHHTQPDAAANSDSSSPVAAFAREHRLTAVMGSGTAGYAIVDGKCLRIGQSVGGMTLIAVGDRTATFQSNDERVELTVQTEGKLSGDVGPLDRIETQSESRGKTPDNR